MARSFIAVKLGLEAEGKLEELQNEAKQLGLVATFPSEFHCTLVFLGELDESQLEKTKETLEGLELPKTEVEVEGTGFFPNSQFIRVFWAGVKGLDVLQEKIAKALDSRDEFTGHVTLARIKAPKNLEGLKLLAEKHGQAEFGRTIVEEILLMKSTLSPQGPQYEVLFSKKLS
ncbi:MAG: RNA 2',3'-cyclic phosphodiesterase [Candidatus Micrarchaeota archaeon]